MSKGFLTRLFQRLTGKPSKDAVKEAVKTPLFSDTELRDLNEKWRDAPLIQLGKFMDSYQHALEAGAKDRQRDGRLVMTGVDYFTTLTRIQSKMIKGALPFAYPKAGTYNYPRTDMFFAEHCYVPVPALIALARKMENEGSQGNAVIFAQALKRAAQDATPEKTENLLWQGYEYESGKTAQQKFSLGAYETGSSFATVLQHAQAGKDHRPGGPR